MDNPNSYIIDENGTPDQPATESTTGERHQGHGQLIPGPWATPARRPYVLPYRAPKAPPAPVEDGYWKVPNQLVIVAATEALLRGNGVTSRHARRDAPRGWPCNERGIPNLDVRWENGTTVTVSVNRYSSLSPADLTPPMVHEMQVTAGRLCEYHANALDSTLAFLRAYTAPGNDVLWLDDVSLVEARGLLPQRKDGRRAGCQTKHRRAMAQGLDDLLALRITYNPPGGYKNGRLLPAGERVTESVIELAGQPVTVPTSDGPLSIAWPLRLGPWAQRYAAAGVADQYALLDGAIFALDPYHHAWLKRLARYFSRYARLSWEDGQGHVERAVGDILMRTGLDALIPSGRIAEKEPQFAAAMAALCGAGPGLPLERPLFAELGYTAEARQRQKERTRSGNTHHWHAAAQWERDTVACTLLPKVCAAYQQMRRHGAPRTGRKKGKP